MFVENYREELNKAIDFDRVLEQVASFASFHARKMRLKIHFLSMTVWKLWSI